MFIDYVTLMLISLVIALVTLAVFLVLYPERDPRVVAPGLLLTGFIALVTGLHMIFTWPLPAAYNIPFGELPVLFGTLLLGAGTALLAGWDLLSLGVFAFFTGLASVVLGVRVIHLRLTNEPVLAGIAFLLTGLGGLSALPVYALKRSRPLRWAVALILLAAAAVWAFFGYGGYWLHMQSFGGWKPLPMR